MSKIQQQKSHFLVSFWAAWCASRPSDNDFNVFTFTISVFCRPPNHFTHTQSLGVGSPSGRLTIFPGHASQPRTSPHTKSPMPNKQFNWLPALQFDSIVVGDWEGGEADEAGDIGICDCCGDNVCVASLCILAVSFVGLGYIKGFNGGDSFNKSKSLLYGVQSLLASSVIGSGVARDASGIVHEAIFTRQNIQSI